MPSSTTLAVFTGAALLVLLIPGPAVLYIVARSAGEGVRAGLVSVAGIHTGTAVHIVAAALGLSAVLVASATAFTAVKLAGAAYLIVLGVQILRSRETGADSGELARPRSRSLRRTYVDGAVVNLLNPKVAVFFLAFVPQFVDPARGSAPTQIMVLGVWFMVIGATSDAGYALGGAWLGGRLRGSTRLRRRMRVVTGTTYIGLGVATALSGGVRPALAPRP